MGIAGNTPNRPNQAAASPAQLALRSALAPYLDDNDPTYLIDALERIQNDATKDSPIQSVVNQTLIHRLMAMLKENGDSFTSSATTEHIDLLGRFDRLLGWQTDPSRRINLQRLDQMAQSLIDELETLELTPRHPLASWRNDLNQDKSGSISAEFLAPWPAKLSQTLNYWACTWGSDTTLALPAVAVKALLDAPALTPIEPSQEINLWGFHGLEWANTALPAIALSTPDHYRSPLSVCILILQTPREVAADFAHFGLICPTLPSVVSGKELSVSHHQFIDWVAVVREMNAVF